MRIHTSATGSGNKVFSFLLRTGLTLTYRAGRSGRFLWSTSAVIADGPLLLIFLRSGFSCTRGLLTCKSALVRVLSFDTFVEGFRFN